jgi:2'-5' RNA ligase
MIQSGRSWVRPAPAHSQCRFVRHDGGRVESRRAFLQTMAGMASEDIPQNMATETHPYYKKLHHLTVCMVPHDEDWRVWEQLTKVRTQLRDPGLYRWPPHANLLYPFLDIRPTPESGDTTPRNAINMDIVDGLKRVCHLYDPFTVRLEKFGTFGGSKRGVLWIYPDSRPRGNGGDEAHDAEPLVALQASLEAQFPMCMDQRKTGAFSPHITVSHFADLKCAREAQALVETEWPTDLSFQVREVYLMQRLGDDGQFERVATIGLAGHETIVHRQPLRFANMPEREEEWVRRERMAMKDRRNKGSRGHRRQRESIRTGRPSRVKDSPVVIEAKRAMREAKREMLLAENNGEPPETAKIYEAIFRAKEEELRALQNLQRQAQSEKQVTSTPATNESTSS